MFRPLLPISSVLACLLAAPAAALAQSATPPTHKHYDRPDKFDAASKPDTPLAPRLQNLGRHVFPVTTGVERAQ
jgi:hypothetical protein